MLTPPFLTIPNLKQTSWAHDGLPDFIWLQAIREETGDLAAANQALDVLDELSRRRLRDLRTRSLAAALRLRNLRLYDNRAEQQRARP